MKKLIWALFLYTIVMSSCSSDFNVGADYKDITTVYALLSMRDTAHYIKINKGFYSETENNLVVAQNPDSLYFADLLVQIEELNNGNVVKTHTLQKVDLVKEGYVKDTGVFANTPNYAYKLKQNLDPSKIHHLVVKNLITGKVIDATTVVINDQNFNIQYPKAVVDRVSFWDYNNSSQFSWSNPAGATFFDLYIRFYYQEKNVTTNVTTYKYKDLAIAKDVPASGSNISTLVRAETFYGALSSALLYNPDVVRFVDTPDVIIQAGGQELKTYIDVNTAQGGITADQIKPNYTNLRLDGVTGSDVFGIFSSRATEYVFQVPFDNKTIDSIKNGRYSKNFNIIGVSTQ